MFAWGAISPVAYMACALAVGRLACAVVVWVVGRASCAPCCNGLPSPQGDGDPDDDAQRQGVVVGNTIGVVRYSGCVYCVG